ncbi:hypothetical protein, partial [Thalassospira povalilytica]|uniref:hypothetical protein n=1 Tax=Thalassospira povalilytica TaxID=732237 RepID=UPI001BB06FB6
TFLQKNDRNAVTQNFCAKAYIGFTFMTCKGIADPKFQPANIARRENETKMFAPNHHTPPAK